jgi:hypothetical protein
MFVCSYGTGTTCLSTHVSIYRPAMVSFHTLIGTSVAHKKHWKLCFLNIPMLVTYLAPIILFIATTVRTRVLVNAKVKR